jgi:hypothetical protein
MTDTFDVMGFKNELKALYGEHKPLARGMSLDEFLGEMFIDGSNQNC